MNILLCGEGATDVGAKYYDRDSCEYRWEQGTIPVFIRRIIESHFADEIDVEFILYTDKELIKEERTEKKHNHGQRRRSKEGFSNNSIDFYKGHADVAGALIRKARNENVEFDIVGMFKDTDREQGVSNTTIHANQKHDEVVQQIYTGFLRELESSAQNYFAVVPIRILENWLLSDKAAIASVCQGKLQSEITDYKNPESLWGQKNDPKSNYPKNALDRELGKCGKQSSREIFVEIVRNMDLTLVCNKCPSFDKFCKDLLKAVNLYIPVPPSQNYI